MFREMNSLNSAPVVVPARITSSPRIIEGPHGGRTRGTMVTRLRHPEPQAHPDRRLRDRSRLDPGRLVTEWMTTPTTRPAQTPDQPPARARARPTRPPPPPGIARPAVGRQAGRGRRREALAGDGGAIDDNATGATEAVVRAGCRRRRSGGAAGRRSRPGPAGRPCNPCATCNGPL